MIKLSLTLFVTGRSIRTNNAIENLNAVLERVEPHDYELNIIDVLENPEAAEEQYIFATPTLVKYDPQPARKIIGDLSDTELLLKNLEITSSTK